MRKRSFPPDGSRADQIVEWTVERRLPTEITDQLLLDFLSRDGELRKVRVCDWHREFTGDVAMASDELWATDAMMDGDLRNAAPSTITRMPQVQEEPARPIFKTREKREYYDKSSVDALRSNLETDQEWRAQGLEAMKLRRAQSRGTPEERTLEAGVKLLERCDGMHNMAETIGQLQTCTTRHGEFYTQAVRYEHSGVGGRLYAKGEAGTVTATANVATQKMPRSVSGQGMYSDLRPVAFGLTGHDIDCENGDFRLMASVIKHKLDRVADFPCVIDYVAQRKAWLDTVMKQHGVDEGNAKRLFNVISNGGTYRTWLKKFGLSEDAPQVRDVIQLQREVIRVLRPAIFDCPCFKPMLDHERQRLVMEGQKNKHEIEKSLFSRALQTCENEVLTIIDKCCYDNEWEVMAKVFDGLVVSPPATPTTPLDAEGGDCLLRRAERACAEQGWDIRLAEKKLHGLHQAVPETVTEARGALRRFEEKYGSSSSS